MFGKFRWRKKNRIKEHKAKPFKELYASKEGFAKVLEESVVGIYVIQGAYFHYVNKKWCDIMGYTYEETVERIPYLDTIYEEDREFVEQKVKELYAGKVDKQVVDFRGVKKSKEVFWFRVHVKIITYQGKPALSGICNEITAEKEAEQALQLNEERLRLTLEETGIGVWDWDLEHGQWYASPIYFSMLGYEPDNGPANPELWISRVHPEDLESVKKEVAAIQDGTKTSYNYVARMLHANGSYRWHEVSGHCLSLDAQGKASRMVGIRKDITELKQAELKRKQSEGRLYTLIDTIPDLVWVKDTKGVFLQCNKRFEELYGVTNAEIIGKTDDDFVGEELADFFRQKDQEAIQAGKPVRNEEEVSFADGHKELLETIKTPMYADDGSFIGVLGIGRDITERRKTEAKLLKNQSLLKDSQRVAHIGTWEYEIKTDKFHWNEETYRIYGIPDSSTEASVELFSSLVHPDDLEGVLKNSEASFHSKRFNDYECRIIRPDKKMIYILATGAVELDEQGELVRMYGIIQDITKRKKIEHELEQHRLHLEHLVQERTDELEASLEELHTTNDELMEQKVELQQTIELLHSTRERLIQSEKMASLGVLSAGIAHEINNPLNFINGGNLGIRDYVEEELPEHAGNLTPYFDAIDEGIQRAAQIVASLSHYSRNEDLPVTEIDLHALIDNCLVILHNKLKNKVNVIRNYTSSSYCFRGNEGKIHQAVLNIIANAEQAIEDTGEIKIQSAVEGKYFVLRIKDTGAGIDQAVKDKVFDPFFTTKVPGQGTGLGLSITYTIIEEHQGEISFESESGKGTEFTIYLPLQ